ncbi:hypothetical protein [Microbacterium murale]|uniref:Secreted protein n=1 Tax=Microbacterium murale TaxID=1081040 RepID=A0ABU0PFU6_9MICO|nr:hypothetical protein [Microbacterium murale]MDQ0645536.1 hypothetical protein [Microbacterium murale]
MTADQISLAIQTAAIVVAVAASIVALATSAADRRNTREIARREQAASLKREHLMFQLDVLARLTENLNRGGSTDRDESARMGTEALTLVGLLDAELVPNLWSQKLDSESALRRLLDDPEMPEWKKWAIESQLGTLTLLAEIRRAS